MAMLVRNVEREAKRQKPEAATVAPAPFGQQTAGVGPSVAVARLLAKKDGASPQDIRKPRESKREVSCGRVFQLRGQGWTEPIRTSKLLVLTTHTPSEPKPTKQNKPASEDQVLSSRTQNITSAHTYRPRPGTAAMPGTYWQLWPDSTLAQ